MKTFLIKFFIGCAAGVAFFASCMQSSPHLLVRIDQRDSITVREYQSVLNEMGANNFTYEEKRKIALNMIDVRLKALSAVDAQIDQQDDVKKLLLQYENELIRDEAKNKFIYPYYVNDSTVDFYMNHIGLEAEVKNFVYRYKDSPRSKINRSRDEAKHFVDSIYAITDTKNYDTLTYQFSEYIDRQTGRGNYRPDRLKFGTLPYQYENIVFKSEPKTILKPIEIQGAFLIPWVIKFKQDSAAAKPKNKEEASKQLRKKIETVDAGLLFEYYRNYADSLLTAKKIKIIESALDTFLRIVPSDKDIETILKTVEERYHSLTLVEVPEREPVTLKSFLSGYDLKNVLPKLTHENLIDILREQMRDKVFIQKVIDGGYRESIDFQIAFSKKKNALLIQRIQPIKIVKPDSVPVETLRRYYETHMDQFQTPGTVKIHEAFSTNESALKQVAELCGQGVDFEKAVDSVKTLLSSKTADKLQLPVLKSPVVLTQNQQSELARTAFQYNTEDITSIIPRKDGGFSIIKILEKKDSNRPAFDTVKKRVESMVIADELKKQEFNWLNTMKQKLTVILYEQNLK